MRFDNSIIDRGEIDLIRTLLLGASEAKINERSKKISKDIYYLGNNMLYLIHKIEEIYKL